MKFPIVRLSKNLDQSMLNVNANKMGWVIDYLPMDLISGTFPRSRSAYDTPLNVVPISNARTSFLENPE